MILETERLYLREMKPSDLEALGSISFKKEDAEAPLFDHGLSLLFSCYDNLESVQRFDILEDRAVNNFIGSKSLEYNLGLIPKGKKLFLGELKEEHEKKLLEKLDQILPQAHLKKIWEMVWKRWKRYVEICN